MKAMKRPYIHIAIRRGFFERPDVFTEVIQCGCDTFPAYPAADSEGIARVLPAMKREEMRRASVECSAQARNPRWRDRYRSVARRGTTSILVAGV